MTLKKGGGSVTTILDEASFERDELTVAEKLTKAMEDASMTQVELATRLAEPETDQRRIENLRRLVNKWLAGQHVPGRKHARRLAEIFAVEPAYFLSDEAARGRAGAPDSDARELLTLIWDASKARIPSDDWRSIPPKFDKKFIAEQLARSFPIEHVLVDHVDEWQALLYARGRATFTRATLGLGRWYSDSALIPGMVIIEALAQIGSIAMLTSDLYRKRLIYNAGYTMARIKKVVNENDELTLSAKLRGAPHGPVANYDADARDKKGDLVARATVILAAH
jgi:3-hydroxyacyl-[acyl-carrier-protein] dehydratase